LGTLDLGGASTQIVFAVPHPSAPSIETSKVTLFNKELALFADSFLCYGVGEMRKQLLAILAKVTMLSSLCILCILSHHISFNNLLFTVLECFFANVLSEFR